MQEPQLIKGESFNTLDTLLELSKLTEELDNFVKSSQNDNDLLNVTNNKPIKNTNDDSKIIEKQHEKKNISSDNKEAPEDELPVPVIEKFDILNIDETKFELRADEKPYQYIEKRRPATPIPTRMSDSDGSVHFMESSKNNSTARRRSVKDIIESINRSQSLLKVCQKVPSNSNRRIYYDDRYLSENEKKINEMLDELNDLSK